MAIRRILPVEALALMEREDYAYVDVRSVAEFEAGHPRGAYNIPLYHQGPGGSVPNGDFLRVVSATFARDAKVIVGCRSGARSLRAGHILEAAGFSRLLDQRLGFEGAGGQAGWRGQGLPVATEAAADRSYASLLERVS